MWTLCIAIINELQMCQRIAINLPNINDHGGFKHLTATLRNTQGRCEHFELTYRNDRHFYRKELIQD